MHVVVCTKQTPDSAAVMKIEDGKAAWGDSPMVVNPWDEYAIEEAIRIKETRVAKPLQSRWGWIVLVKS